jgi:acid phosphatase
VFSLKNTSNGSHHVMDDRSEEQRLYPDDLQIHQVHVIHRHGERTPIHSHFSDLDEWKQCQHTATLLYEFEAAAAAYYVLDYHTPNRQAPYGHQGRRRCQPGELTDKGQRTMVQLGQQLRHLYIDRLNLLDEMFTPTLPLVSRSTGIPRAVVSLQSLLYGLYPPEKRMIPIMTINTMRERKETMYATSECKLWAYLEKRARLHMRQVFYDERERLQNHEALKQLFETSPRASTLKRPSLHSIFDDLSCRRAHGLPLPEGVDDTLFQRVEHVVTQEWFGAYTENIELCRLSLGRFLGQILDTMVERLSDRDGDRSVAMAIYSGHDSTLAPILAALQVFDGKWPPFGGHIVMELASDKYRPLPSEISKENHATFPGWYVRVRYNGHVTRLPACQEAIHTEARSFKDRQRSSLFTDGTLCPFDHFSRLIKALVPTHFEQECRQQEAS